MSGGEIARIVGEVVIAIGAIWGIVRYILDRRQKRQERQGPKLRTHFEDINREVISRISEMARSITIRHERLVTSYAPISESYGFEKMETFEAFELHFSEEAKEWKKLNNQAVELNEKVVSFFQSYQYSHAASKQNVANNYIKDLQQEFNDFAQRLAHKVEDIDKYEMGSKPFRKHRKCPICRKF